MNVSTPDSASLASWSGLPSVSAQPRGLVTNTWIISAPISAMYARPPVARPPVTETCPPIRDVGLMMAPSLGPPTDTPAVSRTARRLEHDTKSPGHRARHFGVLADGPGTKRMCVLLTWPTR